MKQNILIVDDKADVRLSAAFLLGNHGYHCLEAESPTQALELLKSNDIALILLDMNYSLDTTSGEEGLSFLQQLHKAALDIPVVAMTAWSSVELAVQAMQLGAGDFVEKPWDNQRLLQVVRQQLKLQGLERQNRGLKQHNQALQNQSELIWQSDAMACLHEQIERLAKTDATLLLTGENGTGKSSIARAIHQQSLRREQSLVTVNMGAIPEQLFESEMFGHTKGAFTDARENRIGRFEMAKGGTLFLDEIANIPLSQQAKLLRVLESGEFEPVGSSRTQQCDIRLISASNGDFSALMQQGLFRPDLYYRLNTIELRIPALRERPEDILPLARHFVALHGHKYARPELSLAPDVESPLQAYAWPGNIRELSHMMERAVLLCRGSRIEAQDLQLRAQVQSPLHGEALPLMPLDEAEQQLLQQALKQTGGMAREAAELLGISKSAIYRRMEKFGIKAKDA
ncbi:sigma-54 dependent transcriptional regulator [Aliiglaciecola sp. CAU 1673]|uniref:sigma-54-dependent transcriptional regulator n=1 Tax=Aliiglaciecola sp. CAU 1673 TaxID=3032595 RepID=UPI0023DC8A3B|nr:sigma-54 dependent transcriptional regulator [Aliiglaciecola sp. CAU 1673]MDF2179066.1 sigma-54 dependent transcriptional regulator [Aliiglaciecola sp. CAU 1673]